VEQRCTCGAVLPPDARFCHKCGKPQYEEDLARLEHVSAPLPGPVPVPIQPPKTSLRKFRVLAISILMAGAALFTSGIVARISPFLVFLVLLAAGFFAAVIYRKQSGEPLSTSGGAFLGWLTGLWLFLVFVLAFASPSGAQLIQQLRSMPQFSEVLAQNPRGVIVSLGITSFLVFTLLPGLGGLIGATLSLKGRHSS
jgi:hypothetical protein